MVRIIARLNVGGPARHVVWLTEALQNDDCESVLIAGTVPEGEEDMSYFAAEHGVTPVYIEDMSRELSWRDLKALFRIWRVLVAERPDIVHTHTAKAGFLGRIAAFLYKYATPHTFLGRPRRVRVFHTFHGHIFHNYYGKLKTNLFLAIEKFLARFATDKIVVISSQQFKEIAENYGVGTAGQFEVVPLGLDLEKFVIDKRGGNEFRKELGVAGDELLVGIVGRLVEIKNHALFIEAVRSCAKESAFSRVRFVIIGDGKLKPALEEQAVGTGIIFAGNRTDANSFYSALDLVALTSLNEGTPLTLIEAMSFGKPWIATQVGGVVDLAGARMGSSGFRVQGSGFDITESELETSNPEHEAINPGPETLSSEPYKARVCERGVVVDSGDIEGLIEGLRLLLSDRELREELGTRGKKFVGEHYSKERLIKDIKALYGLKP